VQRAVLFDVDGTLVDSMPNLRRVWDAWADHHRLDRDDVWACATRTVPLDTFAEVAPTHDPARCLAVLHSLEDEDARKGDYRAFAGAREQLSELPQGSWAVVTGNYRRRVMTRFSRLGLPLPSVVVDAASVRRGKPDPEGFIAAASRLGRLPRDCLVVEDSQAGLQAGVSAGMTVYAVNDATTPSAVHHRYPTLEAAAPDIRGWLLGYQSTA
jgi:sugar-phosphatase